MKFDVITNLISPTLVECIHAILPSCESAKFAEGMTFIQNDRHYLNDPFITLY